MTFLDRRSKDILIILAESKEPITTSYIGEKLDVSSRTIKRQMIKIEDYLNKHNFKLVTKPGYGVYIKGDLEEKNRLLQLLKEEEVEEKYSPEERQLFLLVELLKNKEPIKMYKFKSDLNVSEGTISSDLDKIEDILLEYDIKLIRKPGFGVYIDGEESELRKLIINIIYDNNFQNELLDILGNVVQNNKQISKSININAQNKLLNMIDKYTIKKVEEVVSEFENEKNIKLNGSQYVALIVHLALVIERIKNGDKIHMRSDYLSRLKENKKYLEAKELANRIEEVFNIKIPEEEVGYITMHLAGSTKYFDTQDKSWDEFFIDNYRIIKIAKDMIELIQEEIKIDLLQDEKILINLAVHLEPAIKRLLMNMEIRNPLLDEIKENYYYLFKISKKAAGILEKEFNVKVPDAEVGYIALHIGGAIERINNYIYKVIIVCPSGIGVSRLLCTKIINEFSNIEILGTLSAIDIYNADLSNCDFIISTVPINVDNIKSVAVNPLLLDEDKEKIRQVMGDISLNHSERDDNLSKTNNFKSSLKSNINYSKAILQVLDNYRYYEDISITNYEELINKIAGIYTHNYATFEKLKKDILEREKLGQLIIEESNTIIIHCRTNTVKELQVCTIKLLNSIKISEKKVDVIVVLLAPIDIEKEYIEVMSYITQNIFKGEPIKLMTEEEIYKAIHNILEGIYLNNKINRR